MVCIAKASVHKSWIVDGSRLIEQVVCDFSSSHGFLLRSHQELFTQDIGLIEVHNPQVIKAAKNIKMNLIPHKGSAMIERIMPHKFQITDHDPMCRGPVEMFRQHQRILRVHLHSRRKLV